MSEAKHTPGPWSVVKPQDERVQQFRIFSNRKYIGSIGNSDETVAETKANARLIAAAPDLLEAIKEYFEAYANEGKKPGWIKRVGAARRKVNAAIAKAEGAK